MSVRVNLSELTADIGRLPSEIDITVRVIRGCVVYVDGPTPSPTNFPENEWVTAVGLHPTKVSGVTPRAIESLVNECANHG